MDARGPTATHVLRKTIVAKMCDLSVPGFRELVSNGAGGLLLLIPAGLGSVTEHCREAILQLEEELLASELDIPVYFAEVWLNKKYKMLLLCPTLFPGDRGAGRPVLHPGI